MFQLLICSYKLPTTVTLIPVYPGGRLTASPGGRDKNYNKNL